jgi:hypothetical protein
LQSMINLLWEAVSAALRPDNPMVFRDFRREMRKPKLFLTITVMAVAALFMLVAGLGIIFLAKNNSTFWRRELGGNADLDFVIACSAFQFWFILYASRSRVQGMLAKEAALDGMTSFLMLPVKRLELVAKCSVYPALIAMVMSLLLLPVYIASVALNGLQWGELFTLYTVYLLISINVPAFAQPALSGTVASQLATPGEDSTGETSRRGSSLLSGDRAGRFLKGGGSVAAVPAAVFYMLYLLVSSITGSLAAEIATIEKYVPARVVELLPSFVFSMPLICARLFSAPLEFFSFRLPPILPIAGLVLLSRGLQAIRTSNYLSVGNRRDLADLDAFVTHRRATAWLYWAAALTVAGYLWAPFVRDVTPGNIFGARFPKATGFDSFVVMAALFCIYWTALRASKLGGWLRPRRTDNGASVTRRAGIRFLAGPAIQVGTFVLTCAILSGTFGILAPIVQLLSTLLIIGGAFALSCVGLSSLHPILTISGAGLLVVSAVLNRVDGPFLASPTLAMFRMVFDAGFQHKGLPLCVPVNLLLGVAGFGARSLIFQIRKVARDPEVPGIDPTIVGDEPFSEKETMRDGKRNKYGTRDTLHARLMRPISKLIDNPMTIRDLRAWLRSSFNMEAYITALAMATIAAIALMIWIPKSHQDFDAGLLSTPDRWANSHLPIAALNMIIMFDIVLAGVLALHGAYSALTYSFGTDRRKSTLAFLFTSPMTDQQIARGRCLSVILFCGLPLYCAIAFGLVFAALLCLLTRDFTPLIAASEYMAAEVVLFAPTALISLALGTMYPNIAASRLGGCVRGIVTACLIYVGAMVCVAVFAILRIIFPGSGVEVNILTGFFGLAIISFAAVGIGFVTYALILTTIKAMRKGNVEANIAVH